MAAPMPREAPDSMTTRSAGASRSDAVSRGSAAISEQALVNAAVIDDVLASHESGLSAAEIGDEVATFLRVGKAASRARVQPIFHNRFVCRIAARRMGMQVGVECFGIEESGADAVDGHIVRDQLAHHRGDRAGERETRRVTVGEPHLREFYEAHRYID